MKKEKTNFPRAAGTVTLIMLLFVIIALGIGCWGYLSETAKHSYKDDLGLWQQKKAKVDRINAFWLALSGKTAREPSADERLAVDLRRIFIEPSEEAEEQLASLRHLRDSIADNEELSLEVKVLVVRGASEDWIGPYFIEELARVKAGRVEDLLLALPEEPDPKDEKYDYDFFRDELYWPWPLEWWPWIWGGFSFFLFVVAGIYRTTGWWEWHAEDSLFKIYLVLLLAPAIALWLGGTIGWAVLSSPIQTIRTAGRGWRRLREGSKYHEHPQYEHIRTLDQVIRQLEAEIEHRKTRSGQPTDQLEEHLQRATRLRQAFIDESGGGEGSIQAILDAMDTLLQATRVSKEKQPLS